MATAEDRTYDGLGNNLGDPTRGAAGTQFPRVAPAAYDDGLSAPAIGSRSNARVISNAVCIAPDEESPNPYGLSDYVWQWGQFIDHDITLAVTVEEPFFIEIAPPDPLAGIIPLMRTVYDITTGTTDPRQQVNSITSFLDASMVYGSDGIRAAALRTFSGGRLKTSDGDLMPFNTTGLPNANDLSLPEEELFLGGDVRANEQLGLTCMHTIFVREHNRLADLLAAENPAWDDESIYQRARKIVGAQVQVITYKEFLPALIGPLAPDPAVLAYDENREPGITNEFAGALYRVGHTMVSNQLIMMTDDGQPASQPVITVLDAFFSPSTLVDDPSKLDLILMGLAMQTQREADTRVVNNLRNQLFGPAGAGGLDLAALNIQRGRDHGLASYNDTRAGFGLARKNSFADITSDPELRASLASVYSDVDEIDLWIGGLAEDHIPGCAVGELIAESLRRQFADVAEGDRFFYLWDPELTDLVDELNDTTLSDIIMRNSALTSLDPDVFHVVGPPLSEALIAIAVAGDDATVSLSGADPTALYTLQRSTDGATWQTVDSDLSAPGGEVEVLDSGAWSAFDSALYRFLQQ